MRALLVFLLLISGCGDNAASDNAPAEKPAENKDDTKEKIDQLYSMAVNSDSDLPKCTAESESRLVYIKGTKTFKVCESKKWVAIDVKGEKGEKGNAGEDGASNAIVAQSVCRGAIDDQGDALLEDLHYEYVLTQFANGDVHVKGAISDPSMEVGGSAMYSSEQVGASSGGLTIVNDYQGIHIFSYWSFEFNRANGRVHIEYNSLNDKQWDAAPEDCETRTFGD